VQGLLTRHLVNVDLVSVDREVGKDLGEGRFRGQVDLRLLGLRLVGLDDSDLNVWGGFLCLRYL
jgi:hypothetical protein